MKTTKAQRLGEQDAKIIHDLQVIANELTKANENIAGIAAELLKTQHEVAKTREDLTKAEQEAAGLRDEFGKVRAAAVTVVPAERWYQKLLPRWGRLRVGVQI